MRNREKLFQKLSREYETRLRTKVAAQGDKILTIDDIEQIAVDLGKEMDQLTAQELAADEATCREVEPGKQKHQCRGCQRWVRFRGHGDRTILGRAGVMRFVARREYYCPHCDMDTVPVDEKMRLPGHGYTAHVEKLAADMLAYHSPTTASERLKTLSGLWVSPKEIQRIGLAVGAHVQAEEQELIERVFKARAAGDLDRIVEQKHDPSLTVYIGGDGIHTPMRKGVRKKGSKAPRCYKESKIACVYLVDPAGRVLQKHYVYHMGVPAEFGRKLYALVVSLGLAEIARMVALGDGAAWIWRQITTYFPHAVQVLDWYHAIEHLYATAGLCFAESESEEQAAIIRANHKAAEGPVQNGIDAMASGPDIAAVVTRDSEPKAEKKPTATRTWVKQMEGLLMKGKFGEVIEAVKKLPRPGNLAKNSVRRLVNYLEKNEIRMKYHEFKERLYSIGSGFIESACKQVVAARLKGPGMCWSEEGAKSTGSIRALRLSSDRWDSVLSNYFGRPRVGVPAF